MQVLDQVYHEGYQRGSVSEKAVEAYHVIADEIVKMLHPNSAIDIGCGGGALMRGLRAHGVPLVAGLEGSSHAVSMTPGIIHHDLRKPFDPTTLPFGPAELCSSFDTGEHVESEFHDVFADTIVKCLAPGGVLLFGAAAEGQDGLGHVANAHPCHWIDLFESRGLRLDARASQVLRKAIHGREKHNHCWWIALNAMLFMDGRG